MAGFLVFTPAFRTHPPVLAALVIAIQARQAGPKKRNTLNLIAVAQVAVGVTSFLYHASYTRLFQLGALCGNLPRRMCALFSTVV